MPAPPSSPSSPSDPARSLIETWHSGDPADGALRRQCEEELERLRASWREEPSRFSAESIARLQALAAELRRPPPPSSPAEALRAVFGYAAFRPGQEPIVRAVLAGRDCVGVMPTGAGKSITFQLPARMLGGTALVVSPLIALMKDQVDALTEAGLRATYLNSTVEPDERRARVAALRRGEVELIYAAPEGLDALVDGALTGVPLSLIAVDEAHCISQWGHDFRPAYRKLAGLKRRFSGVPVLALTATATRAVTVDIVEQLGMIDPLHVSGSFFRPNLALHAYKKGDGGVPQVREAILRLVLARPGQSGIVYCLSRKTAEATAEFLRDHGVSAAPYHAGLDPGTRARTQEAFRRDDLDVVVATIAFGMGIDKPDVRFVFHRDMPRSLEGYYQEIGRAGRDGLPSDCVLFFSWADVMTYDRFADEADDEAVGEWHRRRTREMFRFAERQGCRHQALTGYFGQTIAPCGASCDICARADLLGSAAPAPRRKKGAAAPLPARRERDALAASPLDSDGALFARLRAVRRKIADEKGIPPFMVFHDTTLLEMAARRPSTPEALLAISGVGPARLASYGPQFLAAIRELA